METTGMNAGHVRHHHRDGGGHGHKKPDYGEEKEAGSGNQFEDEGVLGRVMPHRAEGHQEHARRDRGHDHQADIDGPVQDLPGTAVAALRPMLLVVAAHLRRQPGNVIAPSSKDVTDYFVRTYMAHRLTLDGSSYCRWSLGISSHPRQSGCNGLSCRANVRAQD